MIALSHCTRASHTTVQQKLAVTEFDLAVMDQELLADLTRDVHGQLDGQA
jgi:hypothetical protein